MASSLALEIVTPVRLVLDRWVESVTLFGTEGEFTVLAGHIPLLSALRVGSLSYRLEEKRHFAFVGGGFAEVTAKRVLILAEVAELPEEIDVTRAMRAQERARARLESERREEVDYLRARAALHRAISRIKVQQEAGMGIRNVRTGLHR
jgi:F-type H+-transporting ATPase subunit epsilon